MLAPSQKSYDEQKAVAVATHYYQGCPLNMKHASTPKYLKGLGNICSCAAYNQGQLTLLL